MTRNSSSFKQLSFIEKIFWPHRFWRRMLETKCVGGDNFEMLVTVSTGFVTNILYFLTWVSGTPASKIWHQYRNSVTNIKNMTPISKFRHQHLCSRIIRLIILILLKLKFRNFSKFSLVMSIIEFLFCFFLFVRW